MWIDKEKYMADAKMMAHCMCYNNQGIVKHVENFFTTIGECLITMNICPRGKSKDILPIL